MAFITRSMLVLAVLYGMVFAIGDVVLLHSEVPLAFGIFFAVAIIGLQYALAPWLIERVLMIWWDEPAIPAMPARHREFVENLCREQNLPPPIARFFAAPNATLLP